MSVHPVSGQASQHCVEQVQDDWKTELDRRQMLVRPGHLVYPVELDQKKLECLYKCKYVCIGADKPASRSFVDIYSNGLMVNAPVTCSCCCQVDNTSMMFWDDPRLAKTGKAGCCKPCTPCFWCPHGFNCCGEVIFFTRTCGCCASSLPLMIGNCSFIGGGIPMCCTCCPTDLICGLKEGEGDKFVEWMEAAKLNRVELKPRLVPLMGSGPPAQQAM